MSSKLLSAHNLPFMVKNGDFSWNFDLFLTFFVDCGYIYGQKRKTWGSTSRPHIGDVVMSLFSL